MSATRNGLAPVFRSVTIHVAARRFRCRNVTMGEDRYRPGLAGFDNLLGAA